MLFKITKNTLIVINCKCLKYCSKFKFILFAINIQGLKKFTETVIGISYYDILCAFNIFLKEICITLKFDVCAIKIHIFSRFNKYVSLSYLIYFYSILWSEL